MSGLLQKVCKTFVNCINCVQGFDSRLLFLRKVYDQLAAVCCEFYFVSFQ